MGFSPSAVWVDIGVHQSCESGDGSLPEKVLVTRRAFASDLLRTLVTPVLARASPMATAFLAFVAAAELDPRRPDGGAGRWLDIWPLLK